MRRIDVHAPVAEVPAVGVPLVHAASRGVVGGVGGVDVAGVGVDVHAVGHGEFLDVLEDGAGHALVDAVASGCVEEHLRVDGGVAELIAHGVVGEARAYAHEFAVVGGRTVGAGIVGDDEAFAVGFAVEDGLAVEDDTGGLDVVVVAGRVDEQVLSRLRQLAVEVDDFGVDAALLAHRHGVEDVHGGLILMVLVEGVAAGVGDENLALVVGYSLGLVADLGGCHNLEGGDVDFGHIAAGELLHPVVYLALVAVGRDVDVPASVRGQLAVVGDVLGGGHGGAVGADELDDVGPVDGHGDEVVVYLDDVVGGVAEFVAVFLAEPLV